jgi:hypothetical protein
MSYKDPEKQKEAQRKWVRQKRGAVVEPPEATGSTPGGQGSTSEGSTEQESVTPVKAKGMTGYDGLHTKDDVNPWGWPQYDSQDRRINPATMEPYGLGMAGLPAEALCEYERKRVREDILVISELPREQVDWLYRCMLTH